MFVTSIGTTNLRFPCNPLIKTKKKYNATMFLQVSFSGVMHGSNAYSQDDLPKAVVRTLSQGSNVMSMDFHPQQQNILLGLYLKMLLWSICLLVLSVFFILFLQFSIICL